jgi:hypothetical protein
LPPLRVAREESSPPLSLSFSGGVAGRREDGVGGWLPVYSSLGCRCFTLVESGVMPKGRWSLEHGSCIWCLVVVLLLSMALQRSEPVMGGGDAAALPLNKLFQASDLATVAFVLLLLSHHGGESEGGFRTAAVVLDFGVMQGNCVAAQSCCSYSVALQRQHAVPLPTLLADPNGR